MGSHKSFGWLGKGKTIGQADALALGYRKRHRGPVPEMLVVIVVDVRMDAYGDGAVHWGIGIVQPVVFKIKNCSPSCRILDAAEHTKLSAHSVNRPVGARIKTVAILHGGVQRGVIIFAVIVPPQILAVG